MRLLPDSTDVTPTGLYTIREEIAHTITHGISAVISLIGLIVLVALAVTAGDVWRIISFSIYGTTLVLLFSASTLYHGIQQPRLKRIFQICDHAAIFLVIAGTYTPFLLVSLRGRLGWTLMAVVWGIALLGVAFKILFIHRFQRLSVLVYVLMGWLSVVAINELLASVPATGLIWLAVGGAAYTIGIIFLAWKRIPYNHTIWHFFVMAGSLCHYFAILNLLPAA